MTEISTTKLEMPDTDTLLKLLLSHPDEQLWAKTKGLEHALKGKPEDEEPNGLLQQLADELGRKWLNPWEFVHDTNGWVQIHSFATVMEGYEKVATLLPVVMMDVFTTLLKKHPDYRREVQRLWSNHHNLHHSVHNPREVASEETETEEVEVETEEVTCADS